MFNRIACFCSIALAGIGCSPNSPAVEVPAAVELALAPAPRPVPIRCEIRGESFCNLGQAPRLEVALINQTDEPILLVGSLDGSTRGRFPRCHFEITKPEGHPEEEQGRYCPVFNSLTERDFVEVRPGESFNPFRRIDENYGFFPIHLGSDAFQRPGQYRIRFVYCTKNEDIRAWYGGGDAKVQNLFNRVPKREVRSPEFLLTVVKTGQRFDARPE